MTRAALRGASGGGNSTAEPNTTCVVGQPGFTPGSSVCDCWSGDCKDRHCSDVKDVFQMIRWDRDGTACKTSESGCQGGALMHAIGSPVDVVGLQDANGGRIDWLSDQSFGGQYKVINDCQFGGDATQPSCSAAAVLRSDLLPIVFNYPYSVADMHPIGLVFDPLLLKESYSIKAMFVLDADTVEHPWRTHPQWVKKEDTSGWDWPSDYDASGGVFETTGIKQEMIGQSYFGLAEYKNWAGFWGNFIDARKAALRAIRDGDTSTLPDDKAFLEPEIDIEIVSPDAWDSMYKNALKAVVVQTNYCSEQLGSPQAIKHRCGTCRAEEDRLIRLGKYGACRVAQQIKQDTGKDLPVIEANLLTNSMYNEKAWEQFRSGEDYIANPEDYMQYYDCCWLLNEEEYADSLKALGWMDGQCCLEQDGQGGGDYWKNCDYCTNCKKA